MQPCWFCGLMADAFAFVAVESCSSGFLSRHVSKAVARVVVDSTSRHVPVLSRRFLLAMVMPCLQHRAFDFRYGCCEIMRPCEFLLF